MANIVTGEAKSIFKLHWTSLAMMVLCAAVLGLAACSTTPKDPQASQAGAAHAPAETYNESEVVMAISDHLGVTAESAASAIERLFKSQGRPVGYITGQEGGGAFVFGVKYGKGTLWMKDGSSQTVYWQGPTVGMDVGGEASRVFTLVYDLDDPQDIYRRFPGVDGSAFLIAGMAIHYERANGITLAPVRAGAGLRLGANVGYSSYTKKRGIIPI